MIIVSNVEKVQRVQHFPSVRQGVRTGTQSADDSQSPQRVADKHVFDYEYRRYQV